MTGIMRTVGPEDLSVSIEFALLYLVAKKQPAEFYIIV